jgi:HNH endonuclease
MKHIHHIIPRHMGGTDDPSNLIELSVGEHAMAHYKLYEQYGKKEDLCAYYMLSGKNQDSEFVKLRSSIGGTATQNRRKENGLKGQELFYGREFTAEEEKANCQAGGKISGRANAENGHIQQIQKSVDLVEAGKKGGAATMKSGKGAFGDPKMRLESCRKGGAVQGKRNADSGHLKRISSLSKRSKGKLWITDGLNNKMINPGDNIPDGFRRGKTQRVTRYETPSQN